MDSSAVELEAHRPALTGHCYRMLGSAVDADDAVQETLVRAWRGLERFDRRSSLRTWLYRIATNVCLDALADRGRREHPVLDEPQGTIADELVERPRSHWLEPIADVRALPSDVDPAERAILRQSIRLAFVAALQHLPPKQRAALLLTEVLGWSAAEVAATLEISVAAVNSALQRARATLGDRAQLTRRAELDDAASQVVDRYVAAFERYDMDALSALLTEDVVLSMPPYTMWLSGREAIVAWMEGRGAGCRGSRVIRTSACGSFAFAQYRQGGAEPWALAVLELAGERVSSMTFFLDTATFFPRFDMPARLS